LEDTLMKTRLAVFAVTATQIASATATAQQQKLNSLQGTWMMQSAYEIKADGTRTTTYGEHPKGLLIIDAAGRYNLQIFRVGRPSFASGDKARGTTEEYREAVLGSSTHFGSHDRFCETPTDLQDRSCVLPELGGPDATARLCL
jgi:Lipocalin-like domain